ncbi:MAG: hypothetical protein ACFB0A_16665 [Croceivirga sp.]
MDIRTRLVILWLLTLIGMVLHFNYHVGELFYGIDIERPDANGEVPIGVFVIRSIYYHLPMIWMLFIMYGTRSWIRISLFLVAIGYSLSHFAHVIGESLNPERSLSQISLLILVFLLSMLLAFEHYNYWKLKK